MDRSDFCIAVISALAIEHACAEGMLDETYNTLPRPPNDSNTYTYGRIGQHNVVLACLPDGVTGAVSATNVASRVRNSFPNLRFGLLVGIGGGAPDMETKGKHDIRIGDVVVGKPTETFGGVVQYDMGKTVPGSASQRAIQDGNSRAMGAVFTRTGSLNRPPDELLGAITALKARLLRVPSGVARFVSEMRRKYPMMRPICLYQGAEHDKLFKAAYDHPGNDDDCTGCDTSQLVIRTERSSFNPIVHYGTIASANQVMRHGTTRDQIAKDSGALCFEMEAAGLMNDFPCLVIRGICDYADSHKNDLWQPYAASVAAAYMKELLLVISPQELGHTQIMEALVPMPSASQALIGALSTPKGPQDENIRTEARAVTYKTPLIFVMIKDGTAPAVRVLLDEVDGSQIHAVLDPLDKALLPLHVAATFDKAEVTRILLERGADFKALCGQGATALEYAVSDGCTDVVAELLRCDSEGNSTYPHGEIINLISPILKCPPLVHAAAKGHARVVELLLDAGANPNSANATGVNALHIAGGSQFDEVVAMLLERGADPNIPDQHGAIPLHAVNSGPSAELLVTAGSDLSTTVKSANPYGVMVGATPLRVCVDSGNTSVVRVLAKHSTLEQLQSKASDGKSVLQAAAKLSTLEIFDILSQALTSLT